ncbi:hypothetical protein Q3G72_004540 [Acer saccharum]|nr:hypothetical protein Q3G72_004540 [Acer saccharum]
MVKKQRWLNGGEEATWVAVEGKTAGSGRNKKLPPRSLGFPLVGETISFMKALKQDKPGEWIQKYVDKYGPLSKTSLMDSEAVVVTGQAGNKFLFSGSDNGIAGNQVVTVANILGKRSMFEVSGHRHMLVRGAILSFLKPESLQRLVGEMDLLVKQQIFQELLERICAGRVLIKSCQHKKNQNLQITAKKDKLKFSPLPGKKLPPGSFGFPLLGESLSFMWAQKQDRTDEWMQTRIDKYGPVFKTSLAGSKIVVLTGQAGNRFVFSGDDNGLSYNQPGNVAKILGKYSVLEISGPKHKLIRGAISKFLKPESIQRYIEEMDSLVQKQLFKELAGKDSVKIVTSMKKINFNVSCSIFFGLPDGKVKDQLLEDFETTVKGILAVPLNFPGTVLHRAIQARGRVCKVLSNLIAIRKREMEEGIVDSQDNMISSLLVLRSENGEPLMEQEILDLFLSLIMASNDTSTVLLTHLVRLMSRDSEIYNKVLAEQNEVVEAKKGSDGKLTWNGIQMMK